RLPMALQLLKMLPSRKLWLRRDRFTFPLLHGQCQDRLTAATIGGKMNMTVSYMGTLRLTRFCLALNITSVNLPRMDSLQTHVRLLDLPKKTSSLTGLRWSLCSQTTTKDMMEEIQKDGTVILDVA